MKKVSNRQRRVRIVRFVNTMISATCNGEYTRYGIAAEAFMAELRAALPDPPRKKGRRK